MPGRVVTVAHGLAMIAAGVDESDLQEPEPPDSVFRPALPDPPKKRRQRSKASWDSPPGTSGQDDDIPF